MRTQLLVALLWGLCSTSAGAEPSPVHAIRGVVRDAQGPVAGVRVLATRAVAGESLSDRRCVSGLDPERQAEWRDCVDVQRIAELVARREGAVPTLAEVRSQADGAFVLEGLGAGLYTLWAESPEGAGLLRDVTPDTGGVELVLGQGSRLSGQVTRGDQVPVEGARVTAVFVGHSRFFETLTDARGHYALGPLPRGAYAVLASHAGGSSLEERMRLHAPEVRRSLWLHSPGRLSGRVLSEKGLPVAGAEVRLRGEEVRDTRTDAQGHFAFVGLPFYVQEIIATHDGLLARQENVSFQEQEWSLTLREPLSEVVGVVRDAGGQPVAGALVRFADDGGCMGSLNVLLTKTDTRGRYRLGPLPLGEGVLRAFTLDHRLSQVQTHTVTKGRRTLDFTLQPGFLLEGQLLDARELPVQDARVSVFDATTRKYLSTQSVGADGRFSLEMRSAGPYLLNAQVNGPDVPSLQASAERLTAPAFGLRPRLLWPFTVEGELVDDEAQPVAGVWVSLWAERDSAKQEPLKRVLTDTRGRFSLQAPAPGRYQVRSELKDDASSLVAARTVEVGTEPVQTRLRLEAGHQLGE